MKTISKFLTDLFIAGSLVLGLTAPTNAQRGGHLTAGFSRTAFQLRPDLLRIHCNGFYYPYLYPHIGVMVKALPLGYILLYGIPIHIIMPVACFINLMWNVNC